MPRGRPKKVIEEKQEVNEDSKPTVSQDQGNIEKDTQKDRLKYKDYRIIRIKAETTAKILGGKVGTPEDCAKYDVEQINCFERNGAGEIYFPARWLRAMLRETSNAVNLSSTVATRWIGFSNAEVDLNGHKPKRLFMTISPMTAGKKMGRQTNFESLEPGITFGLEFSVPNKGVGLRLFKKWLEYAGKFEGTGAFRKGYGTFKIVDFEEVGSVL